MTHPDLDRFLESLVVERGLRQNSLEAYRRGGRPLLEKNRPSDVLFLGWHGRGLTRQMFWHAPGELPRVRPPRLPRRGERAHSGSAGEDDDLLRLVLESDARAQQAARGGGDPATAPADPAPRALRQAWARLIRQVCEVDPLACPRCGATMRVIAVIEQPAVIEQILDHLGIAVRARPDRSPRLRPRHPAEAAFQIPIRCILVAQRTWVAAHEEGA